MVTRRGNAVGPSDGDAREVLADGLRRSRRERRSPTRRRPVLVRAGTLLAVAALGVAAVHALRPPEVPTPPAPRLVGVSISVPPPAPGPAAEARVEASYRFTSPAPGTRLRLTRLTGPLVEASVSRRVAAPPGSDDTVFRVTATAACATTGGPSSSRPYAVDVTRTAPDGRSTRLRVRPPRASLDWASALRQVCWQERASRGIHLAALRAEPDSRGRQLVLTATLRSDLPDAVSIHVLDVADVSTLPASDTGALDGGSRRDFRVRWPVPDCAVPAVPQHTYVPTGRTAGQVVPALEWSVGPSDDDPAALFVTVLSPGQLAGVRAAIGRLCTPPGTTVRVTAATVLPPNPVVVDHTGVAIALRLALTSTAPRVVLGQSPTGLTADARVAITQARVSPVRDRATATVVWRAGCADPAPPLLPVALDADGTVTRYAWRVTDAVLARAYGRACGTDESTLSAAGWPGRTDQASAT